MRSILEAGAQQTRATDPRWFTRSGESQRSEAITARPLRIILADDNREMRSVLATALKTDGYEVAEAATGGELLDALADNLLHPFTRPPADLVISDLRMPGFTGLEILSGLRGEDWVTPFILMTAFGGAGVRNEALETGASAVFDKPFEVDDLRTAVVNLIGRARA